MVVRIGGARCPCGRRGCMEAYAGRAAMEAARAQAPRRERKTDLFKLMEERGRTRLTSSVWARALEREDKLATELIDEAVEALGAGLASAMNLLDVEAVVIGGGLGVRFGQPLRRRGSQGDAAAPVQRRPAAGRAGRRRSGTSAARSGRRCWSAAPTRTPAPAAETLGGRRPRQASALAGHTRPDGASECR